MRGPRESELAHDVWVSELFLKQFWRHPLYSWLHEDGFGNEFPEGARPDAALIARRGKPDELKPVAIEMLGDYRATKIEKFHTTSVYAHTPQQGAPQPLLGAPTTFNRIRIQEFIPLGQRVAAFAIDVQSEDGWQEIASATTIGARRILIVPDTTSDKLRVRITDAQACPLLSTIEVYRATKEPRLASE